MKKNILGIKIDDITMHQALELVKGWLNGKGKHYIVTPNPEFLVMTQNDEQFKKILNKADLAIPDGRGLWLSGDIFCNISGIDFMEVLIKLCAEKGFTTGFLGGRDRVAEIAAERLQEKYKNLKVVFAGSGGEINEEGESVIPNEGSQTSEVRNLPSSEDPSLITQDDISTDILFVAFGPPKQEKWIAKNLDKIPVKVAMGVGGAFDVLSGKIPRAPKWMRDSGFEWLFRLINQPWRIKRQLALVKYVWLLLTSSPRRRGSN